MERLDKIISATGKKSRREVKEMVRQGRILINGKMAAAADMKIDPQQAEILLDGVPLAYEEFTYIMLHKPAGVLSAVEDRRQKTVLDLVTPEMRRMGLFPVGRLDKDTSGLLLLTNDGNFAHRVISPKSEVEKLYYAKVDGLPDLSDCEAFQQGLILADGTRCLPARLELLGGNECYAVVMEGKYHQVKRMLASRGKPVLALRRLAVGGLSLDSALSPGGFRELTETDLCRVFMGR